MPLPRLRQRGGDFPPFFVWLSGPEAGVRRALFVSALIHAALLVLPSAHHGVRPQSRQTTAMPLEVRLAQRAVPPSPEAFAEVEPDGSKPEPATVEEPSPVEQGGVVSRGHYFDSSEVDVKAEPVELAPLVYPEAAYIRRIPGEVKVQVYINASGGIDAVDILSAEPPDTFEMAALDALLKTQFKPAELFGHAVASIKIISINFDPYQDRPPQ